VLACVASVSKTCQVRFDNNKYSVSDSAVGRPEDIHAYADRIVIRQDGRICGGASAPLRARRDGLRSLALCADSGAQARRSPQRRAVQGLGVAVGARSRAAQACQLPDGNRQMAKIIAAVLSDGLPSVKAACEQALAEGVRSADVVINILARQRDPGPTTPIHTPAALRLRHSPVADCARYDSLRSA
jgi:hypothetical protein